MPRYIDADKLKEMIEAKANTLVSGKEAFLYVAKWLDFVKSDDVEPIVRCKDCKWVCDELMGGLYCDHPDNRNPLGCRPDDFCSDGEKMDREVKE